MKEYEVADGRLDCPQTPLDEVLLETLMLGLRLQEGVNLSALAQLHGKEMLTQIWACLRLYHQQGWVEIVGTDAEAMPYAQKLPSTARQLRLTDPEGFLFSNTVLAALFASLEK